MPQAGATQDDTPRW